MKDPEKTSVDLHRDFSSAGGNIYSSTDRRRIYEVGRFDRKPQNKQLLTSAMETKRLCWGRRYDKWTTDDWEQEIFSDKLHFEVNG